MKWVFAVLALIFLQGAALAAPPPLAVYGDSTAVGSRIAWDEKFWNIAPRFDRARWWNILAASYDPPRRIFNEGGAGWTMRRTMERITSGYHRGLPAIIYDRVNDDETEADYMANLKAAVSGLGTRRFLIMPQVPRVTEPEGATAKLRKIDQAINGLWPGNRFSPLETVAFQRALSDPLTRADGLHRNAKGQAIEAAFIKQWLDRRGW